MTASSVGETEVIGKSRNVCKLKVGWYKKEICRKQGIRVDGTDVSRKKTFDFEYLKFFHFIRKRLNEKEECHQGGSTPVWWHKVYIMVAYAVKKSL